MMAQECKISGFWGKKILGILKFETFTNFDFDFPCK
jgi:hypothetical protein